MQARFYNFNKRVNSSAIPTNPGATMEIYFKAPTSIHSPSIRINAKTFNYNYVYIDDFKTYYKITDIIAINEDLWEARLEHDLLATFRDDIINSVQYVSYAWSGYNNMLPDSRCAMYEIQYTDSDLIEIPGFSPVGYYVLTVLARDTISTEFTTTYLLEPEELRELTNYLLDPSLKWSDIVKIVNNPIESILRLSYVPFYVDRQAHTFKTHIRLGTQDTGVSAIKLLADVNGEAKWSGEITAPIPWSYNDFRRLEPFTNLSVWLPMYGTAQLSASQLSKLNTVNIKYSIDVISGDVSFSFGSVSGDYRQLINYNASINIPVAQMLSNVQGVINDMANVGSGVLTSVGGFASGNPVTGVSGIANAAVNSANLLLDAQTPSKTIKGSIQGRSLFEYPHAVKIFSTWYTTEDPDDYAIVKGRPINDYSALSNFVGGYIQTSNASVTLNGALANEEADVNALLDTGIYLE